jgi:hypothetical protein
MCIMSKRQMDRQRNPTIVTRNLVTRNREALTGTYSADSLLNYVICKQRNTYAGKLGMGLGLWSVLMRGALVTSAPVVLTLAGENEGVKHQLDAGLSAGRKYLSSMTGDRNPGGLQGLIGKIQPTTEQQLENFR